MHSGGKKESGFEFLKAAICAAALFPIICSASAAADKPAASQPNQAASQPNQAVSQPNQTVSQPNQAVSPAKNSPDTPAKILKRAKFHTTRHEFKEAATLWAQLADIKPDAYAEAYLGWCHLQLGEKQKALHHINKSIRLNPKSIEGYRYLGYYLIGEGKVPEAVKAFRTSMAYDPHHKCNCGDLEKLVLSKSKKRGTRG
ncbi:MAG: tetratricopeptide repeat protein [Candidatus Melainabacteria bacterium]|nr:tetratricopeptide repeat protein [Candidatus Melainabacteria bacterium]